MCSELPGLDLSYVFCAIELLGNAVVKFEGEVTERLKGAFEVVFDRFLGWRVPLALYEFLVTRCWLLCFG